LTIYLIQSNNLAALKLYDIFQIYLVINHHNKIYDNSLKINKMDGQI
jgi:hypothetical protein